MKTIFFIPAHPVYFGQQYSQEQVDGAIKLYNSTFGDKAFEWDYRRGATKEYVFLRKPGAEAHVSFSSVDLEIPDRLNKDSVIEQHRETSAKELQRHIENINEYLKEICREELAHSLVGV